MNEIDDLTKIILVIMARGQLTSQEADTFIDFLAKLVVFYLDLKVKDGEDLDDFFYQLRLDKRISQKTILEMSNYFKTLN